jgi:hypothetical protein
MVRCVMTLALLAAGQTARAQDGWRFRWQNGQVLTYRVEQETKASEVTKDGKADTKTKMTLTKRWQVLSVDATGIATVQHTLLALRMETTTPSGETLVFDSANLDRSDEKLREQMGKFVGVPLATLRVDARGRVVEVKESKFGPASRFEAEPPFCAVLPGGAVQPEQTWERPYKITVEPPQGTGEKYDAVQTLKCVKVEGTGALLSLTTAMKTEPMSVADRMPLLQYQPEGQIVFDLAHGRLHQAKLTVAKVLTGHAGEGSSYSFQSSYVEQFVSDR